MSKSSISQERYDTSVSSVCVPLQDSKVESSGASKCPIVFGGGQESDRVESEFLGGAFSSCDRRQHCLDWYNVVIQHLIPGRR